MSVEIIGACPALRRVLRLIEQVAATEATLLVTGESGTGKELVARAVHDQSPRRDRPFVALNCAAMPANLLESELFGHVRGAFTDARRSRTGLFVQAQHGTIFLDEIGEMPLEMQAKLLRALQERTVRPVGADVEVPFEARVVTATNRELELDVAEGRFRRDVYYRINVVQIHVPALRERGADVLMLAEHFLERHAARAGKVVQGLAREAASRLMTYDWPGNVRELENCVERAVTLAHGPLITLEELPDRIRDHRVVPISRPVRADLVTLAELQRRYILEVLHTVGGNKSRAAAILGIDRRSLYRRLEQMAKA
jgi:transcriptional regulator with PAS, ATPase and Fis domain